MPSRFKASMLSRALSAGVVAVFLTSCASNPEQSGLADNRAVLSVETAGDQAANSAQAGNEDTAAARPQARIFPGSDTAVKMPPELPPVRLDGEAVMLNFEQAPLSEVVHSILGETLGLDYVIEHPVGGEVTIRTRSPIPRDQLLPILESLLRNNNVLMVRGPDDRFFVSGSANARTTVPSYRAAGDDLVGFSHVIVPLQYISAPEMAEILKPIAPPDAFVRVDAGRNLLILAGTRLQIDGWLDTVTTFDVDQLAGRSVGIIPLSNSEVEDVFAELQHILATSADAQVAGLASLVKVMPVERLNSILVVSPRQEYVTKVQQWVAELDSVEVATSEPTLHVYPVRNGNAAHLAGLLSQVYAGQAGGAQGARAGQRSVAPGMTAAGGGAARPAGAAGAAGAGGVMQGGSFQLTEDVRVVSDTYNNSLLVFATPYEYEKIRKTLDRLDVVATQVLIEASIVEVTLTDDLQYGLEWTFNNSFGNGDQGVGLLNFSGALAGAGGGDGNPVSAVANGFTYALSGGDGGLKAVLTALAQKSLINVISTPSVMVLDNHMASINVGDQQPIQSQQVVTNGGNVQASIEYRDTGVQLQVTPSVNDGGLVTMDVNQSVTDVGPIDAATGQRSFLQRDVQSKVAVRSGESVVLGGLIRDNQTEGREGVPLLMDIPVLGNLFRTNSNQQSRTELLVFITPRVLENDEDLRQINREMRSRMQGLTNFEDLPASMQMQPQ